MFEWYENQVTIFIIENIAFHKRTKLIEIDIGPTNRHYKQLKGVISTL